MRNHLSVHGGPRAVLGLRSLDKGGKEAIRADEEVVPASEARKLEDRVRELERLSGSQDHGGRDPQGGSRPRTDKKQTLLSRSPSPGDFPVKTVAATLQVARSTEEYINAQSQSAACPVY